MRDDCVNGRGRMRLTRVQRLVRFVVGCLGIFLLLGMITGILPMLVMGEVYRFLGI